MLLVECSCEEDNLTEEVDSAAGNWGIAEEETEFSLESFEMPVVLICFADSVKKIFFLVYALGQQRSQLLGGLLTFAVYMYFLRRRSKQNSRCQRSQTVETQFHQRTV